MTATEKRAAPSRRPRRILFVVQRYGREVAGGSERCCREYATRMAARGHDVHVLTSCAKSYVDWANAYPEGVEDIDGVSVHRLPVSWPRPHHRFELANGRVIGALLEGRPTPAYLEESWMHLMGPTIPGLEGWIDEHADGFDVIVFFTYLYFTTWMGLRALRGRVPAAFHPTAHREPYLGLELFDDTFRRADGYGFLTEEEAALVAERFGYHRPSMVCGVGVELDVTPGPTVLDGLRSRTGLGDRPYLVYVGRVTPDKGTGELVSYFRAFKSRHPSELALLVVGEIVGALPDTHDVFATGFVSDEELHAALDGATALVHPSYFESFSMVLTEAWAHARPALVQGGCDVLVGQCARSGGGFPYDGYEEFEAALSAVLDDPELAAALGRRGRAYVEQRYGWDALLDRYEVFLDDVVTAHAAGRADGA